MAQYQAREPSGSGLGAAGSAKPIRRAEVEIVNSSGSAVQCAETDATGAFSFVVPQSSSALTIKVNSRSNNSHLLASVLDSPNSNTHYSLTTTVTPSSSQSVGTITATVTGEILGGAFNILDQLLEANIYLRAEVANCSSSFSGCTDFTVAPKSQVYWQKGYNPGTCVGAGALSFYLPSHSRLFILGGEDGDTDSSDTDHFDNSIIIHEYGHFLEDVMFSSDSPGGSHNGNKVIDPRLAWSEGWGNFIQAAVRSQANYIDTLGNIDGSTAFIFNVTLESATTDVPTKTGEGNFREFSVTRFLWDIIDTNSDTQFSATDNISGGFAEVWAPLTKTTQGFRNSNAAFRDIGLMHLGQSSLSAGDWTDVRAVERHRGDRQDYAQLVVASGSCSTFSRTLTPGYTASDTDPSADFVTNNDFFHFKQTSTGSATFVLEYNSTPSQTADLDLYIYDEDANLTSSADLVGYARTGITSSQCSTSTTVTETVSVSSLPAGNYLIRVGLYPGSSNPCRPSNGSSGPATSYQLKHNGTRLCNSSLF